MVWLSVIAWAERSTDESKRSVSVSGASTLYCA